MAGIVAKFCPWERKRIGLLAILEEADRIISSNHKHFFYLSLTLLLPLSASTIIFSAALTWIDWYLSSFAQISLFQTRSPPPTTPTQSIALFLLDVCIFAAFSLASTAAITQSVARAYLDKEPSLSISLNSIPKSLTRLFLTGVAKWSFTGMCMGILSQGSLVLFLFCASIDTLVSTPHGVYSFDFSSLFLVMVPFLAVAVLLAFNVLCGLALVMAVLEEKWGLEALEKSMLLVKGHRLQAFLLFLLVDFLAILMLSWSKHLLEVDTGSSWKGIIKVTHGLLNLGGWIVLHLYSRAVGCVFYLSCKSLHTAA